MLHALACLRRFLAAILAAAILLALPLGAAQARVFFGFGFGYPVATPFYPYYYGPRFIYGPPVVYAPPVAYAPAPVAYAAPPAYASTSSGRCNAGAYICPLHRPGPVGAPCSCPTNTSRVAGRID